MGDISIHAPVKGATDDIPLWGLHRGISIHAPVKGATVSPGLYLLTQGYFNPRSREGSDIYPRNTPGRFRHFNPRSREGSDLHRVVGAQGLGISIHAPVKGATSGPYRCTGCGTFQSTLP